MKLKQGLCLFLFSILLTIPLAWSGDDDDSDDNDFDDDITEIIEKEREKAEEEAEERAEEEAEKLLENLLEQRLEDDSDFDDDFEDEMEDWLEEQLEAKSTDDDLEERMEEELEKHLESIADDDDKSEEQLEFIDDKLQQLWQFEDDIEESLLPPLPDQMIALISAEELAAAKAEGAVVLHEEPLTALGAVLVTFDSNQSIAVATEPNHLYQLDNAGHTIVPPTPNTPDNALMQAKVMGVDHTLVAKQKIGLMDSSINLKHPCFSGLTIHQQNFHDTAQPNFEHGTAMASILLGDNACAAQGLLSQAQLFNAVVFAQNTQGMVVASAAQLVSGLNWLLTQQVGLINMSLSGPANRILEQALKQVSKQGIILVASAGNDGPAAFPRYPAAYPEVIAVTAVDQQLKGFTRAAQGPHIEISAPGVNVFVAQSKAYGSRSGTSFAAAMITAVLASEESTITKPDLSLRAKNLGPAGRDNVYGFGLMQK